MSSLFPTPYVWLYKCFDAQGECLYVGVTSDLRERRRAHKYASAWYKKVAKVTVRYFDDSLNALPVEKQTIKTLCPIYNKIGDAWYKNGWKEAKERQALKRQRYQAEHQTIRRLAQALSIDPKELLRDEEQ